jgi:hypothetical protein
MITKLKNFRKEIIRKIAQLYANVLISRLETLKSAEDKDMFNYLYDQACFLNDYCFVLNDIYLD